MIQKTSILFSRVASGVKSCMLFIMLLCANSLMAQSQQGYVKTKGRMVNGQHVKGHGLKGAVVALYGRQRVGVQNADGSFSFPVVGKSYTVQSVSISGYQLVDADAAPKTYAYSGNPLYLVMETPTQQAEDKLLAGRKIRRNLQRQLQLREDEIDAMQTTLEEKQRLLQQLYRDQENNERLIADMAKHYAELDYDQLDSLNRQISDCILNGLLTRADSLLRSKGDLKSRISEIHREQQAIADEKKELAQRQKNLDASEEGNRKKLEDAALDCLQYFERYKMSLQFDSAAYYIELRAELDTTNARWQFDAASYFWKQNQYHKAVPLYERALSLYRQLAKSEPQKYEPNVARTLNNLANLYYGTQRHTEAETMYQESLSIRRRLAEQNPQAYERDVAATLNNLAGLYSDTQRLTEAETKCQEALSIYRRLAEQNPQAYEPYVARTLNNLASLYSDTQRLTEAETMYQEALSIRRRLAEQNPQAYEPDVAATLNNLAMLYKDTQRLTEADTMYQEALNILRRLAEQNPQAYEPDMAVMLNNLAILYSDTQRLTEAETIYQEALSIRRRLAEQTPQAYEPDVAATLNNLANLYKDTQRLTEAETMYQEALSIRRHLAEQTPQAYEPNVAQTLCSIGVLRLQMEQYADAIAPFAEALEIYRKLAQTNPAVQQRYFYTLHLLSQLYAIFDNHAACYTTNEELLPLMKEMYANNPNDFASDYAEMLGSQSLWAIFMKQYAQAEQLAREGLQVDSTQHRIAGNLAAALLFQGKMAEAELVYRQYKSELKDSFLDDFRQFAEAGVIPKEREADVERMRQMLNEE